jgi:hypothetical protein
MVPPHANMEIIILVILRKPENKCQGIKELRGILESFALVRFLSIIKPLDLPLPSDP